jgi:hypothetical protein
MIAVLVKLVLFGAITSVTYTIAAWTNFAARGTFMLTIELINDGNPRTRYILRGLTSIELHVKRNGERITSTSKRMRISS